MKLLKKIEKGNILIQKGKHFKEETQSLEKKVSELNRKLITKIENMSLSELERTNLIVNIFSEVLNTNIYLCSNDEVFKEQLKINQESVLFTVEELRKLNHKNSGPETIIKIYEFKQTFPNSKLII